ncbi:MAG: ABC transporter substrate-binding protein [Pseudoclavibacter sp.]
MRFRKKSGWAVAVGALAFAVAMTGCTPGAAEEAEHIYVEGMAGEPLTLVPTFNASPYVFRFGYSMMEPLVGVTDDYEIIPMLAEDWEVSDDNRQVTFHLREGVTWHDGEPFTSDDVRFNFEEIMPLEPFGAQLVERLESVETPDESTVVVNFDSAYGPLLETLATQFMLPEHVYAGGDYVTNPANFEPVGTGPMVFDEFVSGEHVTMTKNPEWWGGEVEVDRAVFRIMVDGEARALSFFAGDFDSTTGTILNNESRLEELESNPDMMQLEGGEFPSWIYLGMNARSEPLADVEVRKLVFAAVNRDRITDIALNGLGTPATSFIPPDVEWAVHPDIDFDELYPLDIDEINEGLDAAGYPADSDGIRFTLKLRFLGAMSDTPLAAQIIESTMQEIGIKLELESTAGTNWAESVFKQHDYDLMLMRQQSGADPSLGMAEWYSCNPEDFSGRNPTGVCDDVIEAAADGALTTASQEGRAQHLYDLQERAAELMFFAPLSWSTASYSIINTARWNGMDATGGPAGAVNWKELTWVGG